MFLELKHLSPSSINTFITNRPKWFAQKFRGMQFTGNVNTVRGQAVEAGIVHYLENKDITKAIEAGVKHYEEKIIGIEDKLEFKQSLGPLISVAINGDDGSEGYEELESKYGKASTQESIKTKLDGCDIPVIGYLDFKYNKVIIDNKVTAKTPTELNQDYIIQGAIYRQATGLPVYFLYEVALKKPKLIKIKLTDDQYEWGIKVATKAATAIERVLYSGIDADTLEAFMFPDPSGGYGGPEQLEVCKILGLL